MYNNLKIWDKWRYQLTTEISAYTTFTNQDWFPPGHSGVFLEWAEKKLNKLKDIIEKSNILLKNNWKTRWALVYSGYNIFN